MIACSPSHSREGWSVRLAVFVVLAAVALALPAVAQTPPYWNGGTPTNDDGSAAIPPAPWPLDSQWHPYTWGTNYPDATLTEQSPIDDQAIADPSNGGTSPQNYVNVTSGCPDQSLPSIYYYYDPTTQTIFFRWRVGQIANTYATGPSAGAYSDSDPWKSALWTVFFDTTGDGYRNFAAHLDGSSGSPSAPIDILRTIWSNLKSNSIDYIGDPADIHSLFTNPTAFVDNSTLKILQFDGSPSNAQPTTIQWPNGASETTWDYGTTRSINITSGSCVEYFVDYQIPVAMLNATSVGGPVFDANTPFQFLFATANSLQNPFQKDVVWDGPYVCDATAPGPYGDALTLNLGLIPQPITTAFNIGAPNGCAAPVSAQIMDNLTVNNCQSVSELVNAQFKYWYDANGNGLPDEPTGTWVNIGDPTTPVGTTVTANWNLTNLIQGQYLLALEITDENGHITQTWQPNSGNANTPIGTTTCPAGDPYPGTTCGVYSNAPIAGLSSTTLGINYQKVIIGGACGAPPPTVTKTASPTSIKSGDPTTYTLTITNTSSTQVTISQVNDTLPAGFTYVSTDTVNSTVGTPTTSPAVGSGGTISWDFPDVVLPGSSSRTLIFTVDAGSSGGTFYNSGTFVTSVGNLTGTDTTGVTVTTANLLITKMISLVSAPSTPVTTVNRNDAVRFTIVVTNNSQTTVTGGQLTDPLPPGFTYTSASPSPSCSPATPLCSDPTAVGWSGLTLAPGGSQTFTIDAVAALAGSATNTATITSTEAPTVSASASVLVSGPALVISKIANVTNVAPTGNVTYTIEYANIGTATATGLYLYDSVPTGFTFVSATPGLSCSPTGTPCASPHGSDVGWSIGSLAAGVTQSVSITFSVGPTAASPSTNTATLTSTNAATVTAQYSITPISNTCSDTNYYFRSTTGAVSSGSTYSVARVAITANGSGYTTMPTVGFTSGGGTGAAGTAFGNAGSTGVLGVNVTDGGSGYTSAPTVTFTGGGGTGTTATATLTNSQRLALTTASTGAGTLTTLRTYNGTLGEAARFYQDPVDSTASYVLGPTARVKLGWNLVDATQKKMSDMVTLAMYNPATEAMIYVASASELSFNKADGGGNLAYGVEFSKTYTLTIPANTILRAGWRLVWLVYAADAAGGAGTSTIQFAFDGAASTPYSQADAYNSYGTVCLTKIVPSLTKIADKLSVTPGVDSLTYTLNYANTSTAPIRQAVLTDPLPAGTTFVSTTGGVTGGIASATITNSGSGYDQSSPPTVTITGAGTGATAQAVVVGGQVIAVEITNSGSGYTAPTITIAPPTSGTTATASAVLTGVTTPTVGTNGTVSFRLGTLAAGASGSVTITVRTTQSMTGTSFTNTATLSSLPGPDVTASTNTLLARPNVLVSKTTSATNLVPGDVFQYTITVLNTGTGLATGTVMTDQLPTAIQVDSVGTPTSTDAVASVTVTNGGSGYTSLPTVTFSGGGGTGATGTAVISSAGAVTGVIVTNPGSGYTSAPAVAFSGGGGTGAAATAVLRSVSGIPASGGGSFTFTVGAMRPGDSATLTLNASVATTGVPAGQNTLVNTASVVDDYNATPRTATASVVVTAYPVLNLTMTATPSANRVDFVDVTSGGSYTTPPTVSFSGGGCTGVVATVSTQPPYIPGVSTGPYTVTGVTITNPGSGCTGIGTTGAPTVVFSGSGSATATAWVGPGPGDTITYDVTVSNTGNADATGVVINGTVPGYTSWLSGGTFSGSSTSSTATTIVAGGSSTLTYVVTVDPSLPYSYSSPFGVTTLIANGSATSTNTAAPPPASETLYTGASPDYTIAKTPDGGTLPYPAATLTSNASSTTSISVSSSSLLAVNDYVVVGGTVARVTAISGTALTLSSPVTAASGSPVIVTENYTIAYSNAGDAHGASVVITDTLPANLLYAGVPIGVTAPTSAPAIGSNGTVTWDLTRVSNVLIGSGGSGYALNDPVVFSGGGGSGAAAHVSAVDGSGAITAIQVTNPGSGYTSVPSATVSSVTGSGASVTAVLDDTLSAGSSGTVSVLAYPSAAGSYTNAVTIDDGTALNTRNASDTATTTFGALSPTKATSTPQVTNSSPSNIAHYVVTIQNPLPSTTATGVVVTDNLPSGFTYVANSTTINSTATPDSAFTTPPSGSSPVWTGALLDIPGGSSLVLEFNASVAGSVATGTYDNQVLVTSSVPSLTFDYLSTPAENVQVCNGAPTITAPTVCAGSTGNVASVESRPLSTYAWSITNGTITNFNVTTVNSVFIGNGGSGYTVGDAISFSGGGGSGAAAQVSAVDGSGAITAITVTSPGSGYTSAPTATVVGTGSGASVAAVLGQGILYSAGSSGSVGLSLTLTEGTCSVTSSATAAINATPVVTTDTSSQTACPNSNLTFAPTISGASTYQWQVSTDGGTTWANLTDSGVGCSQSCISGSVTTTLTITNIQTGIDGYVYRLVGTSASGCPAVTSGAAVNVTCNLDLAVTTNSDSPDPVYAGSNITYTQVVANVSSQATTGPITFSQPVPSGTTFVSMTPPAGWTCGESGGVVTCTTSSVLAANTSSGNFTLVVTVPDTTADGTTITDTATVAAGGSDVDSVSTNNSKATTTTVSRLVDLQVVKDDTASASGYGAHLLYPGNPPSPQSMDWILTVGNAGPTPATSVTVTDIMPSGFTYGSSSSSTFTCTFASPTLTCTAATLPRSTIVTISGGGGSGADATATVSGGAITAINVVHGGSGYTSTPTVTLTGAGSGQTATATVSGGQVTSISVSGSGSGYVAPASITISGTVTASQTTVTNSATATASETDSNPSNNTGTDTVSVLAPTLVKMLSMDATQTKKAVTIHWQTSEETDNLGFNVYREGLGGDKEKLNLHIITGSAFFDASDQQAVRAYRFVDHKPWEVPYPQYWIEDIDLDGTATMHGPITPVAASVDDSSTTAPTEPDRSLGSAGGIFTTDPGMGIDLPSPPAPGSAQQLQQWQLAATPNGKIVVTKPGWYSVKKSDLVAAGYDPGSNPTKIALFTNGTEVPIIVDDGGDGVFDPNDTIQFFGQGVDTPTTGSRIYYVNTIKGSRTRIRKATGGGRGAAPPSSFPYTFRRTERTFYVAALTNNGDGENFFGRIVTTASASNAVTVANLDPAATSAELDVELQGFSSPMEHLVAVGINGHNLGTVDFFDRSRPNETFTVPTSWLVDGENSVSYQSIGGPSDVNLVVSVRLTYPHLYRADSDALLFTAPGATSVEVGGFTTKNVRAVDLTDPANPLTVKTSVARAHDGTYTLSILTESGASRTILAFGDDRMQSPAQVLFNAPSTWNATANAADLVIITNSAFSTAANTLAAARTAQGIRTSVIDVQNLYDEFTYGEHSPYAIRSFLDRSRSWIVPPKYAILLGDASFDPRDYLGLGSFDFVPTKIVAMQLIKSASDDWFADFDGTGLPSIAIGRLSARTEAEAEAMVDKLVRWPATPPSGGWSKTVTIVNDVTTGGVPFKEGADRLASVIPAPYQVNRIDFASQSGAASRSLVIGSFNTGSLLTEYVGHGSVEIWGRSIFTSNDATALTNGGKLPFVVTMDCLNGFFHDLYTLSMAEALMKNPNGGAIAVWASSSLTSPDQQLLAALELNWQLFGSEPVTLGQAVLAAKRATSDIDVRRSWIFFGDPTLRLR